MENFYFIGVDVSKKKLDICVMCGSKVVTEEQVTNHQQAILKLINELKAGFKYDKWRFYNLC